MLPASPLKLHTRTAPVLAALTLAACTDAPPPITELTFDTLADGTVLVSNPPHGLWDANPGTRWRLVESLRIGSATEGGPDAFGDAAFATVDALDRLWIVDSQANEVRVFDGEGRFVRTVGGRGEGPGEFMGLGGVLHGPDGEMWAEDDLLDRYEIFDTAGARIGGATIRDPVRGRDGEAGSSWHTTGWRTRTDTPTGCTGAEPRAASGRTGGSSGCRKIRRTRP